MTVRHRARRAGSHQSNLRQAPLIHEELFVKVGDDEGVKVMHDGLGENTSTRRTELLGLPVGTLLRIGDSTALEAGELRTHAMLGNALRVRRTAPSGCRARRRQPGQSWPKRELVFH
ncbi:hypothetical protein ACFVHR_24635 [Streptomyces sp. NPDC127168]|uniref:hypothetical protein n=1 Tax=unclassified Streptomyces TaxID=2593676 RepID=UPI0036268BCC